MRAYPEPEIEPEPRDTLLTLAQAYLLDRQVMDETHPMIIETNRCRYCHGGWQHFANCRFDGHVRCAVSMPFQRRMVAFFDQNPLTTYWSVATALGVTAAVVKAWWVNVKAPKRHNSGAPRTPRT